MYFPASNRALTRTLMAGALVLAGTSACSRSDRSESGIDTNAAVMQDTMTAPGTGQGAVTATDTIRPGSDTIGGMGTGTATGDTAPARLEADAPRAATATPPAAAQETRMQGDDTGSAGYRAMERDTAAMPAEFDSARVTDDTSEMLETSQAVSDTAGQFSDTVSAGIAAADTMADTVAAEVAGAAGYAEMARDTTGVADQIDTTLNAVGDTAGAVQARVDTAQAETQLAVSDTTEAITARVADTTYNDGRMRSTEDSADTTLAAVSGEAAVGARGADTTENAGRIRPPEDSTEILGSANAADTGDEAPVSANAQGAGSDVSETVATSEAQVDEVGAAAIGGTVTGAEAVALMTRGGAQCTLVDPEENEEVRWDMSSTPVTLNPCGLGSMNLSKIRTER